MRADYRLIADVLFNQIEKTRDPAIRQGVQDAALALTDAFHDSGRHPNFDRRRFLDACGLEHAE